MLAAVVLGSSGLPGNAASAPDDQTFRPDGASGGPTSNLVGLARASGGGALSGVVVSARQVGKSYTTSVFTDERGEYVFPPLEHGRYEVWAQAVGFDIARAQVSLQATEPARETFTLTPSPTSRRSSPVRSGWTRCPSRPKSSAA